MWCDAPNWVPVDSNGTLWASACYYHTIQASVGTAVLGNDFYKLKNQFFFLSNDFLLKNMKSRLNMV